MVNNLRHDLDGATPEEQAIHLALQREPKEVDLSGYATQNWVRAQGYLTSVPDSPSTPGEPGNINLDGYATEDFVKTHVGDTALVLSKNINTVTRNLAEEANNRRRGDEDVRTEIEAEVKDRATGDEALAGQISDLQEGFDAAIIAGQEGAENINLELQSYLKKDEANTSFLKLTGGNLTGNLLSTALYKTTRNTGYAFQVRPDNGDTTVFIHTSGHIEASGYIKVDGTKVSLEGHTHTEIPGHNHDSKYVKGNFTITKSSGNWYIS